MADKLTDTVNQFLARTSELYGQAKAEHFSQDMFCNCLERGMESPLEHLVWIAVHAMCAVRFVDVNPAPEVGRNNQMTVQRGIYLSPQVQVGKYRVDFVISQSGIAPEDQFGPVVLELDGHAFHDKDKHQRSYEKARDRYLVKQGYRVLHYTGSDVVKDPFAVAHEALEMVAFFGGTEIEKYNSRDPLCLGDG